MHISYNYETYCYYILAIESEHDSAISFGIHWLNYNTIIYRKEVSGGRAQNPAS